jgi:hypothetical protein
MGNPEEIPAPNGDEREVMARKTGQEVELLCVCGSDLQHIYQF